MLYQDANDESFAEAASYFPSADAFVFGPDEYLNHLRRVKEAVAHSGDRVAQRLDSRRMALLRDADGGRRRRRAGAERLPHASRCEQKQRRDRA